jgi:selenocysteine lyase/cysteine desulfurase
VRQELSRLQNEADANPDKFIRFTSPTYLDTCRRRVSEMLHSHCDEVVITLNATTALNTVLRNLYFQQGDHILMLSCVYGAVKKTAEYLAETTPVQLDEVDCTFPVADDELISRFRAAVRRHSSQGTSIKVAIFDTIASMPGVRLPFERLIEECRAHGILSVVDGAHGIGCIPINLSQLRPDFFVSNCHKYVMHLSRGRREDACMLCWHFSPSLG